MLARLWWKEYRVFGPVLLTLVLFAAGFDLLLVSARGEAIDSGTLMTIALVWAGLYAFAVGAAAFAGERESNTLGFLDALPVARRTLWLGKTTFALASTFGLSAILAGLAALGAETLPTPGPSRLGSVFATLGPLLFEAVAWGLFWSAMSRNPLLAGAMAVVSVGASSIVSTRPIDSLFEIASGGVDSTRIVTVRLLLAFLALAGSALGITWRPSWGGAIPESKPSDRTRPIAIRASSTGRSLAWQAWREGWTTWLLVAVIGLGLPVAASLLSPHFDELVEVVLVAMAGLVAGVSVFGTENASGSQRFLVHHGVKPGTVWWRKFLIWGVVMASILGLTLLTLSTYGSATLASGTIANLLGLFAIAASNAFLVGLLCGMAIHRRITAALVGVMVLVVLVPAQFVLVSERVVPEWTVVLVPLILVAISRAWAGDWLLEREGARPWVRLGCLIAVPFGLLFAAFIGYRAFGVRDVGPQYGEAILRASDVPPDQDAAEVYRRVIGLIRGNTDLLNAIRDVGRDADTPEVIDSWKRTIEMTRKASTMPRVRFATLGPMTKASPDDRERSEWSPGAGGLDLIEHLIATDAWIRRAKGDLAGAWDDILAQFRMANQSATSSPTLTQTNLAIQLHHRAVALAFDWLGDSRQSPETIRRALADLKALPPLPNLAETMRVESLIIERTLDQSGNDLADLLLAGQGGINKPSAWRYLLFSKVIAAPWERLRARRIGRRFVAEVIPIVGVEPSQRAGFAELRILGSDFQGSRLALWLTPSITGALDALDRELASRRALEQATALVAWKFDHSGEYPETLQALVPGLLDRLPLDPFSGHPFGYVRSEGDMVASPVFETPRAVRGPRLLSVAKDHRLLYSVGPDRKDDGGKATSDIDQQIIGDYVYVIP